MRRIFDYYFAVAGHIVASKITSEIVHSADSLSFMPHKAPVEQSLARQQIVYRSLAVNKIFKVIYFVDEQAECVVISTIWDCRRNPSDLQKEF